jgi:hypothetical protein
LRALRTGRIGTLAALNTFMNPNNTQGWHS